MSAKPRIAIVSYSRTGHSRQAADRLAVALDADRFSITARRYAPPLLGYVRAAFDSLRQHRPRLDLPLPDLTGYHAAVICGPIWTSYPATPLRSYFNALTVWPPVMGLLLTSGAHSPPEKAYALAERDLGRSFVATTSIANGIADTATAGDRIRDLAAAITGAIDTSLQAVEEHPIA